jgi:hypothetical protein
MVIAPLRNKAEAKAEAKRLADKQAKASKSVTSTDETKDSAAETAE